jgi:hypothetical protein
MEALMPKRAQPRWGRLGMVCVRGFGQADDQMVDRGIILLENGRGDRGCLLTDKQFDRLVAHLDFPGVPIFPDQVRSKLDFIREFVLKGLLQDAQVPTQCERNAALGVIGRRIEGFLIAISALGQLPDWELVEIATNEAPSPVRVFTTLPHRLHDLASMARAASRSTPSDGSRATDLVKLSTRASHLADALFFLDFASQNDVLECLSRKNDYAMDSLAEVVSSTKRLALVVDEVRKTGRKSGGPRPFKDLRQAIFWLGELFEACGGRFTHTPRQKTKYDGVSRSAAGLFIGKFLQMCDEKLTPQAISDATAEVIHKCNKAGCDKLARGGSF